MSVPRVGPLISTAMVAAIGSGEAFERGRDFAAWLGLVPRQYSTGGRSILGRISKRGSKYLRTLLIQAAKVLLMRPHNWARYSFGSWLNSASERLHRNKLAAKAAGNAGLLMALGGPMVVSTFARKFSPSFLLPSFSPPKSF